MTSKAFDATNHARLAALGRQVLAAEPVSRQDGQWLFSLDNSADIFDLLSWANRIREHFKGNKIHLCSIVNVKAGGCSENCKFCAQSALYQTDSPRYGLIESGPILQAAEEASANGVVGLGLVAAWRGLEEGPVLDEICDRFEALKKSGKARPDASLGIIKDQKVADRLKDVGVETVFVRYPREGHGLAETKHQIDCLDRSIDWYEKHFPPAGTKVKTNVQP